MLFGESRLNPWGIAHKILNQKKYTNALLFDEIDDDLILSQSDLSNLLSKRPTLSQDDRTKLIEHEVSEIKFVINSFLLNTSPLKNRKKNDNDGTRDDGEVEMQNNLNWEKV